MKNKLPMTYFHSTKTINILLVFAPDKVSDQYERNVISHDKKTASIITIQSCTDGISSIICSLCQNNGMIKQ